MINFNLCRRIGKIYVQWRDPITRVFSHELDLLNHHSPTCCMIQDTIHTSIWSNSNVCIRESYSVTINNNDQQQYIREISRTAVNDYTKCIKYCNTITITSILCVTWMIEKHPCVAGQTHRIDIWYLRFERHQQWLMEWLPCHSEAQCVSTCQQSIWNR